MPVQDRPGEACHDPARTGSCGARALHGRGPMLWMLALALAADPLLLAQQRAQSLVDAGDAPAALDTLRPLFERYDQDTRLALQVGWLALEVGELPLAEQAFLRADALSGGGLDGRLGLSWALLRGGRVEEARAQLDAIGEADDPRVAELAAALAPVAPEDRLETALGAFVGAPEQAVALGGGTSVAWTRRGPRVAGGLAAAAMVWVPRAQEVEDPSTGTTPVARQPVAGFGRGNGYGPGTTPSGGAGLSGNSPWARGSGAVPSTDLSLWGRLGTGTHRWGVEGVAALLGQTRPIPLGFVAGGLARISPYGDLVVEGSLTRPRGDSSNVGRIAATWWLPLGPFAAKPGGSLQLADGAHPAGQLTLFWVPEQGAVWVGGRFGAQAYRSDLQLGYTTSWPEPSLVQLWGGGRIGRLARGWLSLGYVADGFATDAALAWAHSVTLTLSPAL